MHHAALPVEWYSENIDCSQEAPCERLGNWKGRDWKLDINNQETAGESFESLYYKQQSQVARNLGINIKDHSDKWFYLNELTINECLLTVLQLSKSYIYSKLAVLTFSTLWGLTHIFIAITNPYVIVIYIHNYSYIPIRWINFGHKRQSARNLGIPMSCQLIVHTSCWPLGCWLKDNFRSLSYVKPLTLVYKIHFLSSYTTLS